MIPSASTQAWAAKGGSRRAPRTGKPGRPRHPARGALKTAGQRRKSRARCAWPGSADFRAVDHDVTEVVVGGVVERATTSDQVQLGVGHWAEHRGGGEVGLRILMH